MPKPREEGGEEEEDEEEEGASDRPVHLASGYSAAGAFSSGIRSLARSLARTYPREVKTTEADSRSVHTYIRAHRAARCRYTDDGLISRPCTEEKAGRAGDHK